MAVKTQFPLFAPPQLLPSTHRPPTEIRFSRWNNANAQKFVRHERSQKELEDHLRFDKRFDSALTIAHNYNPAPPHPTTFKSTGTPSAPSSPSIPGKSSKYSKNPSPKTPHPAFKPRKIPVNDNRSPNSSGLNFRIDENGVSYEMPEAPFLYQHSYTETPKVKPLKLREPLVSPFGPETMAKPWLGRKPKKKLPEFDLFQPVQAPGPFLPGSGPKYVRSQEEVLGAPLTKEEIEELIRGYKKSNRQLNIGRDGLTHNMLDNIHALWKRRRVCKLKCKGVCTVDMDNVCQQLEEKTGGKIIQNRGGVIYLFCGRNYNYRSRPRFPLMLWKPATAVYPRLIKLVPEGLTLEEASDMRKRGRDLTPICKLAKNGFYCDLVKNVREACEACELVRINCQGLKPSDYKKIGAKLKDLVPCVLLSFEGEHILMWRGRDWKSLIEPNESPKGLQEVKADVVASGLLASPSPSVPSLNGIEAKSNDLETSSTPTYNNEISQGNSELGTVGVEDIMAKVVDAPVIASQAVLNGDSIEESSVFPGPCGDIHSEAFNQTVESDKTLESSANVSNFSQPKVQLNCTNEQMNFSMSCTEGILLLREQAVENGMAYVLDDDSLDVDTVFKKSFAFAKTAPTGPVFSLGRRQLGAAAAAAVTENKEQELAEAVKVNKEQDCDDGSGPKEAGAFLGRKVCVFDRRNERKTKEIKADYLKVAPQVNLRIDELAKLLA